MANAPLPAGVDRAQMVGESVVIGYAFWGVLVEELVEIGVRLAVAVLLAVLRVFDGSIAGCLLLTLGTKCGDPARILYPFALLAVSRYVIAQVLYDFVGKARRTIELMRIRIVEEEPVFNTGITVADKDVLVIPVLVFDGLQSPSFRLARRHYVCVKYNNDGAFSFQHLFDLVFKIAYRLPPEIAFIDFCRATDEMT